MKKVILFSILLLLLPGLTLFSDIKDEISITASAEKTSVPQNRTVDFSVTVRWRGDRQKYSIANFDNPDTIPALAESPSHKISVH